MAQQSFIRVRKLTREKLKSFKGLENLSDHESALVIETLERLSQLLFEHYKQIKDKPHEKY
jgi:hypothetical protein